ncbi:MULTISPECIES: glutathionylspermidine synthase family protein [unclassified Spirosoma]|uniref:glutathionylspermidine synthase family protein n=1 Tax=unclassified Spirosoma TaxID=2621999 RepID=UPI00095FE80D|nr:MULTISPECIES: glutathionylspermidine synthase family protein [unclassified Spirosoma]MBN8823022.1 glutathionylspermidine synthase family protein [Spirosoma sp.]OJW73121.1 MAG: glutathionylspermidine synthase [Spirosoma sp. 48-14]
MISLRSLAISPITQLRNLGWNWMLGQDTLPYLANEVVVVQPAEADAYYDAANELFEMFVAAGQHIIDENRFAEVGIPANLVELIKLSWDDDRNIHLYGRFDLAGGIDGQPIKLIEFNADTATCLPETAIVQYAHLKANNLDESQQFNAVFETLTSQFEELLAVNPDLQPTLLLSAMRGYPEDDTNVALIGEAAREAGFEIEFDFVDHVEFSAEEGIFWQNPKNGQFEKLDFWFKLVPWEAIAEDEPELVQILTDIVRNRLAVVLNPAYTLLFQSKYILKILWELYPNHPLLLETDTKPLAGKACVEKVVFGREGANTRILNANGSERLVTDGDYGDYAKIYQQYVAFPQDSTGNTYQAGVFYAGEGCGLGFRRGGLILDNTAGFVGHMIP